MLARLALLLSLLVGVAAAGVRAEEPAPIAVRGGERIPLRDGVELNATLYSPATPTGPLPVLVSLTPYISDRFHELAGTLARFGYVVALVDVRGRGSSGGAFDPFAQETQDGYDVVAWLARQPWSNGKVGMFGGSYGGYNQWAAARERPPGLATIVPVASAHPGVDFPFAANVKYSYLIQWLALVSGKTPNPNLFGDQAYWTDVFRRLYRGQRPFRELDRLAGFPSPIFQRWLDHPTQGPYWDAMVPTAEQYRALELPILSITGHYDGDQPGALTFYRNHLAAATPAARDRHFLIIGPWDHAGTRRPQASFGGWTFGPASLLDMVDLHRQWYAWTMGKGPRPELLRDRVAVYVTGREAWRWAPSLEALAPERRTLFLSSRDGAANDVFAAGTLAQAVPTAAAPDRLVYDPCDLSPLEHETPEEAASYLTAQRRVLHLGREGVVYHSAPFTEPVEITGSTPTCARASTRSSPTGAASRSPRTSCACATGSRCARRSRCRWGGRCGSTSSASGSSPASWPAAAVCVW
jgi:uncharacterized protein